MGQRLSMLPAGVCRFDEFGISQHAERRMQSRGIGFDDIQRVIEHGRTYYARGAVFKIIGRNEAARQDAVLTFEKLIGVHVVLSHDGVVITAYRNRRFRKADFRKLRRHGVRRAG